MKLILLLVLVIIVSCNMDKEKNENINQLADWSVVENYINEKYDLSAAQFDSILIAPSEVPLDIIYAGM